MNQTAWPIDRRFMVGFAVAATCAVFAGFAPTYYFRSLTDATPLPPLVFAHGLVFTSWILLFVAQTTLVAIGRTSVHRQLGRVGGVLAAVMLVTGWITAIAAARRGYIPAANAGVTDPLAGLAVPLRDLLMFVILVATGLHYRRKSATHKRLLVIATVNLLPAALGRLPMDGPLVGLAILAFVLAGPVYDWIIRRGVHQAYIWSGALTVLSILAQFPVGRTEVWHRFASWLTR